MEIKNKEISSILYDKIKRKDKIKLIKEFKEDCNNALNILENRYCLCPECKDYYRKKSFEFITKTQKENVLIWDDPINGGSDEYELKDVTRNYYICPKGHELSSESFEKLNDEELNDLFDLDENY